MERWMLLSRRLLVVSLPVLFGSVPESDGVEV